MRIAVHDYAGHPFQFELSRELARRGHDVLHLFFAGDTGPKGRMHKTGDDPVSFSVHPVEIGARYSKSNFASRLINDVAYGRATAAAVGAFAPDIVISGNTPLDAQRWLMAECKRRGTPFVFWMQDFYSRAVRGILGAKWRGLGSFVADRFERLERAQLRGSDAAVLISDDFRGPVHAFGVPFDKLHTIPNWGALADLPLRPKINAWSQANGLADKFVLLYSGTLGLKHDPLLLTALADGFADDPEVVVAVAAGGLGRDALDAELAERPRSNMRLLDLQPMAALPDMLGAADVVVALLEADAGQFSIPSKVLSYYCAGRPLLLSAPLVNASARTTAEIGAGQVVASGDPEGFVAAARALRADPQARTRAGRAGRDYAERNFDIGAVTDRFQAVFEGVLARNANSPARSLQVPVGNVLNGAEST